MRYYRIDVSGQTLYTSHPSGPSGPPNPGALMVEMDLPQAAEHRVQGSGTVKVYGVGIDTIAQSNNFTKKAIAVYGGMGVGLPLATQLSSQAGLLVQGTIYPAFGAWIGTEQSITFGISNIPPEGEYKPANLTLTHKQGDKFGDVMQRVLQAAYPGYTIDMDVADSLVFNHSGAGFYQTLGQFADVMRKMSISIFGGGAFEANVNYPGVRIATSGTTITVSDGQQSTSGTKQINFNDLLGQPTWVGLNTISVTTVLRGDIALLDKVTMPPTLATSTAASSPQFRDGSVFQGTFQVEEIRHIGNSRGVDAMAWATVLTLVNPKAPEN